MSLFLRVCSILLYLAFVVLAYLVILWVLGMLGISIPENILKVVFVIIALMAIIGALSGRWDNWWKPGP
jgi:hypothetical protein